MTRNVFPTPVGMNRLVTFLSVLNISVPHTRGDEPLRSIISGSNALCSPHPWG